MIGAIYSLHESEEAAAFYVGRTKSEQAIDVKKLLRKRRKAHMKAAKTLGSPTKLTTRCQHKIIHLRCLRRRPIIKLVEG